MLNKFQIRYHEKPSTTQDEELHRKFEIRMDELEDGFVGKDSVVAIKNVYGDDANLWKGSFHNKSKEEKEKKDKELQEMGLFV